MKGAKDLDTKIQDALAAVGVFHFKMDTYFWELNCGAQLDHNEA